VNAEVKNPSLEKSSDYGWSRHNSDIEGPNILPFDENDTNISVALTGASFKHIVERKKQNPYMFNSILLKGMVYARMSPDDKALLVESLQENL